MDNLIIQLQDRPVDSTGKVPAWATYWDKNSVNLEKAIEDLARQGFYEGLLTSPAFSVNNMVVSYVAFQCLTEEGTYCDIPSGDVTHDAADPANPRIDIISVKPNVRKTAGEIVGSGEVEITKGTAAAKPKVPDTLANYLKIAEVDVPASAGTVILRDWKPMYIKEVMLRPMIQETPDMTVKVNFFRGYVDGNVLLEVGVQDSPAFTAPAADKCAIDILHIDSSGTLAITQGTEVDLPNEPSAPTYPADKLVICEVYLEGGDTAIYQWQVKDVRPVVTLGAGLKNIIEDTTPQLGGDLDAQTKRIYDVKWFDFKTSAELTISSGEITVTQTFHTVDTEGDGGTDDLVTISGGVVGRVLILRAEDDTHTVVIKHGSGNIWLKGKADLSLDDLEDCLILVYTTGSKWVDLGTVDVDVTALKADVDGFPDELKNLPSADGLYPHRIARATYDFGEHGGVQGAIGLGVTLPDNAVVVKAWYEVLTTLTSGTDAATISIDIPTDDPAGIVAAIIISDGTDPWDAGNHAAIQDGDVANFSEKLTAAREISITIAGGEDVTAGKFIVWCEYVVSD